MPWTSASKHRRQALLVRVGMDMSTSKEGKYSGGGWNGPVNSRREFVYVPIPEIRPFHSGMETPYAAWKKYLSHPWEPLPADFDDKHMHLDPDFAYLTYGDWDAKARKIRDNLAKGDLLVFYAGLKDYGKAHVPGNLCYAIIGLFVIDSIEAATTVLPARRPENAHTRLSHLTADDIVVRAKNDGASGRLTKCIEIGEWRPSKKWKGSYYLREKLEKPWGLNRPVYIQQSALLQCFDAEPFYNWFEDVRTQQRLELVAKNNLTP